LTPPIIMDRQDTKKKKKKYPCVVMRRCSPLRLTQTRTGDAEQPLLWKMRRAPPSAGSARHVRRARKSANPAKSIVALISRSTSLKNRNTRGIDRCLEDLACVHTCKFRRLRTNSPDESHSCCLFYNFRRLRKRQKWKRIHRSQSFLIQKHHQKPAFFQAREMKNPKKQIRRFPIRKY